MSTRPECLNSENSDHDDQTPGCRYSQSGAAFSTLLNAFPYGVLLLGNDGTVLSANEQAFEELHLDAAIKGSKLADVLNIFHCENNLLPQMLAELNNGSQQETLPPNTFIQGREKDKHLFISGRINRLNEDELLFTFRNVVEEVTRDFMLKMALSSTKIFPWFYDMERNTMIIDPRYYEYTRIPTEDCTMTLDEFSERIHPDDRAAMAHAFSLQLNGEHYPYPVSYRLRLGNGSYEWFEGQSTYLGQVEGLPYRVVGICMSTQAHKNIEEALTAAKDKAEQSDRLKSAFLANMSHEIRTPLNAIVGFSNLLVDKNAPVSSSEALEYAELISKNCDYLLTLVSDILDLSRIETGTIEYNFAEQPLSQLLSDICQKHSHLATDEVKINLLLPQTDVTIETDELRLRQAMDNLIGNALKFTDRGHIDVGYSMTQNGDYVRLFVADTGRGIPRDQFERIFDRFYKVETFVQGAGLGLSICKTIAENLGGTISVTSRLGKGSRFTLCLPRRHKDRG